jgi:hypothetical protein
MYLYVVNYKSLQSMSRRSEHCWRAPMSIDVVHMIDREVRSTRSPMRSKKGRCTSRPGLNFDPKLNSSDHVGKTIIRTLHRIFQTAPASAVPQMHINLATLLHFTTTCITIATAAPHQPSRPKLTAQERTGFPPHLSLRANNWGPQIPCDWPLRQPALQECVKTCGSLYGADW